MLRGAAGAALTTFNGASGSAYDTATNWEIGHDVVGLEVGVLMALKKVSTATFPRRWEAIVQPLDNT